jgi:cytochrome P450
VKKLSYLQCCIQESLRLLPSVPSNGFTALKDDILPGGYFVPKDAYVIYSAYILHRRADIYPNPEVYNPDRWINTSMKPFEFMSFHGGPRECLGMNMAYLEAKVMICNLLKRFRLRMNPNAKVELKRAIILTSRRGIHMNLYYPTEQECQDAHQKYLTELAAKDQQSIIINN